MQRLFFPSSGRQGECVCENGEVAPPSFLFRLLLPLQICTSDHELPVDFLSPGKQSKLELNCSERSPCSPGREWDGSGGCWPRVEKSVCVLRRQAEIRRYVSPFPTDSDRKRRSGCVAFWTSRGERLFRGRAGGAWGREETTNRDTSSLRCISSPSLWLLGKERE